MPAEAIQYQSLTADKPELLIQCIRNVYGDSYPLEEFYDPAFIAEEIRGGLLHSEVALNEAGEAIGNICTHLEQVADYTADGSVTMVDSRYRGYGILGELGLRSTEVYRKQGICGIHIYALAWHQIVQQQAAEGGAVEVGVLPAYFSRDINTEDFSHGNVRLGSVMMYLPLSTLPGRVVYLPDTYKEALLTAYQGLEQQRSFQSSPPLAMPDKTEFTHYLKRKNSYQRLRISRPGADYAELLAGCLSQGKELEVSYLDLPLDNPNLEEFIEQARAWSFFFGGLLVDRCGRDWLRLQKVMPDLIDPASLSIASPRGRQLLDIVLSDMPDG